MKTDRAWQRAFLQVLEEMHPMGVMLDDADAVPGLPLDLDALQSTAVYLAEHGLVHSGLKRMVDNSGQHYVALAPCTITAKGIDFIADDGGLSAILNTVTVKLEAEQWRELLASRVETLPISHDERTSLSKAIRGLPAKALERVFEKLLDWSVEHAGEALPLLRTLLAQAAG